MREQSGTRQRIQEVALELFIDRGYEATSLREIAEHLGVTKAALYYHFKSKEDIVASLLTDRTDAIAALLAWGQSLPRTEASRVQIIERYAAEMHGSNHHKVMRFMERNQAALRDSPKSERARELALAMIALITPPGADLTTRIRCAMGLFALHATWFLIPDEDIRDDERATAALAVALDLTADRSATPAS